MQFIYSKQYKPFFKYFFLKDILIEIFDHGNLKAS